MRRAAPLILILAAALSACQTGPASYVQQKWQKTVHPCPAVDPWGIAWSPDSQKVAYWLGTNGVSVLMLTDLASQSTERISNTGSPISTAQWSPDGSRILLNSSVGRASLINSDGSNQTYLPAKVTQDGIEWLPDSTHIAFTELSGLTSDLLVMNLGDETFETLLSDTVVMGYNWSPDGTRFAWEQAGEKGYAVLTARADGTDLHRIALVTEVSRPIWSPDGKWIAFLTGTTTPYLQVSAPDGTSLTDLAGHANWPYMWLPDSSGLIAIDMPANGEDSIVRLGLDGTIRVLASFRYDYQAALSPDASKIAYLSYGRGLLDIYMMNVDGTNKLQLTHNPGYNTCFNWPF